MKQKYGKKKMPNRHNNERQKITHELIRKLGYVRLGNVLKNLQLYCSDVTGISIWEKSEFPCMKVTLHKQDYLIHYTGDNITLFNTTRARLVIWADDEGDFITKLFDTPIRDRTPVSKFNI